MKIITSHIIIILSVCAISTIIISYCWLIITVELTIQNVVEGVLYYTMGWLAMIPVYESSMVWKLRMP